VAFQQAAQGNDVEAIKAAHAKLGGTCKACHDKFREDDH
jgi:cytochrome c556